MSGEIRQETVIVGRNRYSVETAIDQETWGRIMAFTDDVLSNTDQQTPPDRRLLLAWLNLVYWVDKQNSRLQDILASDDEEGDR